MPCEPVPCGPKETEMSGKRKVDRHIGDQGFPIRLRAPSERPPTSMLLGPPSTINSSYYDHRMQLRRRHTYEASGMNNVIGMHIY